MMYYVSLLCTLYAVFLYSCCMHAHSNFPVDHLNGREARAVIQVSLGLGLWAVTFYLFVGFRASQSGVFLPFFLSKPRLC